MQVTRSGHGIAWLILIATVIRLLLAVTSPLTPQEAYYWTWSRFPDWSYFDHPPLVSYGIALTTTLMGPSVFAIKCAAVLWALGWNVMWARLIIDMFDDRKLAFHALLALNLTLLYELYGVGPTPDGPLMFGWIGTVWALWRIHSTRDARWWYVGGLAIGVACLGKYSGVLLVPVALIFMLAVPTNRRWLATPHPYLAMVVAGAVFTPVLVWNLQHEWASLAFQSTKRLDGMGELKPRFFLLLVATQLLLLTPYIFCVSVAAMLREAGAWIGRRIEPASLLLLLSALVPMVLFVAVSFRSNAKINWLLPAWWSLVVLGVRASINRTGSVRWRALGLSSPAAMLVAAFVVAAYPNLPLPGDLNIWSGWRTAAVQVDRLAALERAQGRRVFVFSPNYKISSLLWFYRPGQERTYAQDILGRRALQFDFFPMTDDLAGATGLLVVSDQAQSAVDFDAVRSVFETLERVEVFEVGAFGRPTRRVEIWRGTGYRGRPARLGSGPEIDSGP